MSKYLLTAAYAGALVAASLAPAAAIDINVGGVSVSTGTSSNGGTTATVSTTSLTGGASTSVGATVGGGSNVASLNTNATGTPTTVGVGNTNGPLVATNGDANGTSARINLGGLGLGDLGLGDIDIGGLIPGNLGGGGPGENKKTVNAITVAFGGLGAGEQRQLRLRCRSILAAPGAFDTNLVALCRVIAKIGAMP